MHSAKEENEFRSACWNNQVTFVSVMAYLREVIGSAFRKVLIRDDVPPALKKQVEIQCKLEGLI